MTTVTLTLPEASALALVLNAAEADAHTANIRAAVRDALELLQIATARTAGLDHVPPDSL